MKTSQLVLLSALLGASGLASAAYDGSRDDRMQSALDDYHKSSQYKAAQNSSSTSSTSSSAGSSIRRGADKVGSAVKHGAEKVGHAVGTGLHKAGEAIDHAGQKLKGKTAE